MRERAESIHICRFVLTILVVRIDREGSKDVPIRQARTGPTVCNRSAPVSHACALVKACDSICRLGRYYYYCRLRVTHVRRYHGIIRTCLDTSTGGCFVATLTVVLHSKVRDIREVVRILDVLCAAASNTDTHRIGNPLYSYSSLFASLTCCPTIFPVFITLFTILRSNPLLSILLRDPSCSPSAPLASMLNRTDRQLLSRQLLTLPTLALLPLKSDPCSLPWLVARSRAVALGPR